VSGSFRRVKRHEVVAIALVGVASLSIAACSTVLSSSTGDDASSQDAVAIEPTGATTTTTLPSTTAPTTTVAPTTTLPPTTVAAPTTVVETTTTLPPPPPEPLVVPVAALTEPIQPVGSSSGGETTRAQWRLLELGFWLQNANGEFGLTTRQAVMAFQKFYGLSADGVIGPETAALMSSITEKPRARAEAGTLVEVDKSRQVLFFVIDGATQWILNTSTGSEVPYEEVNKKDPTKIERGSSITPVGLHAVNRERAEGWWEGDLGEIYRPKYFVGGIAVHGSNSIPNYPASHGCVRVSVPAMDWIWESGLMPIDTPVWVHGAIPA
jgi:peptidoglycan hydrolase-like protein with peptidoglycan-binding domain